MLLSILAMMVPLTAIWLPRFILFKEAGLMNHRLALVVGGGRWSHPSVVAPEREVPRRRRWIGWACVAVFVLTFVPVPFGS